MPPPRLPGADQVAPSYGEGTPLSFGPARPFLQGARGAPPLPYQPPVELVPLNHFIKNQEIMLSRLASCPTCRREARAA